MLLIPSTNRFCGR